MMTAPTAWALPKQLRREQETQRMSMTRTEFVAHVQGLVRIQLPEDHELWAALWHAILAAAEDCLELRELLEHAARNGEKRKHAAEQQSAEITDGVLRSHLRASGYAVGMTHAELQESTGYPGRVVTQSLQRLKRANSITAAGSGRATTYVHRPEPGQDESEKA